MHALGLEFGSAAQLSKRPGSVLNCLWGNALKRSPGIIRKSRVSYPGPGFLSSATWPSLPKKHYNGLKTQLTTQAIMEWQPITSWNLLVYSRPYLYHSSIFLNSCVICSAFVFAKLLLCLLHMNLKYFWLSVDDFWSCFMYYTESQGLLETYTCVVGWSSRIVLSSLQH